IHSRCLIHRDIKPVPLGRSIYMHVTRTYAWYPFLSDLYRPSLSFLLLLLCASPYVSSLVLRFVCTTSHQHTTLHRTTPHQHTTPHPVCPHSPMMPCLLE